MACQQALVGCAYALDKDAAREQVALLQPVDKLIKQGLDFHQHQRVKVGQQAIYGGYAIGCGDDGDGVVLLGQRHAGVGGGSGKGINTSHVLHGRGCI